MKKIVCSFFIGSLVWLDALAVDLFHIKRNKNRNEFHYEAQVTTACEWKEDAVVGLWHMLEVGPDARENIALWEGGAYGHEYSRNGPRQIEIVLNAKRDSVVIVDLAMKDGNCEAQATTQIDGKPAQLRFIYVCARERRLMWPRVQYVELHGFDVDGAPIVERFPRTKWASEIGDATPLAAGAEPPMGEPLCGHATE